MGSPRVFRHEGFDISYIDEGEGPPVLLIHGFASSAKVNWISTGWTSFLHEQGYRTIAFDHRGHGQSGKSYAEADYSPAKMASDAAALLDHLHISRAHVIGYSMGARVSTFLAMLHPEKVATLTLGGLGIGLVKGVGDWDPIAAALLTDQPDLIADPRGAAFRKFADATKSDRRALAACISRSRELVSVEQLSQILTPTLIAVGTKDDIAGSPHELAALMPNATALDLEGRDHMLAVGDRVFKRAVAEQLGRYPI
jgi:pimeloyl-ACP methyl ester carboxylesterase